jgi:hypothetical protein
MLAVGVATPHGVSELFFSLRKNTTTASNVPETSPGNVP